LFILGISGLEVRVILADPEGIGIEKEAAKRLDGFRIGRE